MKKAILYSDILRPGKWISENIDIIYNMMSYQLKTLGYEVLSIFDVGFKIEEFLFINGNIKNKADYKLLNFNQLNQIWIQNQSSLLKQEAQDYFASFFKDSIGISYHSSKQINDILSKNAITYLDFFETGYRYLDDSYFSIATNNNNIQSNLLNNYALSKDKLYIQAYYLKTFFIRNNKPLKIEPNSALIICQTPIDIVLIKENGIVDSLTNYIDKIEEIAKNHSIVYYKLHPKSPTSYNKSLKELFNKIPNSKQINDDMYQILADKNIITCAGINSSSLYEAEFFDKKVIFFGKKYFYYHMDENKGDNSFYIILNSNKYIFDKNFWDNILNNKNTELSSMDIFDNHKDIIRNVLNISSSYSLGYHLRLKKLEKIASLSISNLIKKYLKFFK